MKDTRIKVPILKDGYVVGTMYVESLAEYQPERVSGCCFGDGTDSLAAFVADRQDTLERLA